MEQLQFILKQKTSESLSKFKKKYERIISLLFLGILLNIAISPFLHFILGDDRPVFRLTFSGLIGLIILVIASLIVMFFYWIKYKDLNKTIVNEDLKHTLSRTIKELKRSLKQEITFIIALFICLFVVGRITSQYLGNGDFDDVFKPDILLAKLAGLSIMGFYIYRRARVYRVKIKEFQSYLSEFEENT